MKRGIVVGKFYPFHSGHAHLIRSACAQSDQVTVLVVDRSTQVFTGEERAQWIREVFPQVEVRVMRDIEKDDDSQTWADYTVSFLGYHPDVVFTSEDYGEPYARYMGATHVLVDRERNTIPISATQIRENPYAKWEYLSAPVRARLARRIAIVGAESTGTTTLARDLARHYETVWTPEFGRFYTEGKLTATLSWQTEEFVFIAEGQNRLEDEYARHSNRVLICDTNAWATRLWHERYLGHMAPTVDEQALRRRYDFVFLTGDEIPFEQDGMRDGEHIRHDMHQRFETLLKAEGIEYRVLRGNREKRLQDAIDICDRLLMTGRDIFEQFPREERLTRVSV